MKLMKPMKPMEPMTWKEIPRWWPSELGDPNASGSQNGVQYAFFGKARRLLLRAGGETITYDTEDHEIQGISQASDAAHTTLTSPRGELKVRDLKRVVSVDG